MLDIRFRNQLRTRKVFLFGDEQVSGFYMTNDLIKTVNEDINILIHNSK